MILRKAAITSDIGVETTLKIIESLEERVQRDKYLNSNELNSFLKRGNFFINTKYL